MFCVSFGCCEHEPDAGSLVRDFGDGEERQRQVWLNESEQTADRRLESVGGDIYLCDLVVHRSRCAASACARQADPIAEHRCARAGGVRVRRGGNDWRFGLTRGCEDLGHGAILASMLGRA